MRMAKGRQKGYEAFEEEMERRLTKGTGGAPKRRPATPPQKKNEADLVQASVALTIRLPVNLWERVHLARIRRRKAVNQIVIEALKAYLSGSNGPQDRRNSV